MNPYIIDPRKVNGVTGANYAISQFQKEISNNVEIKKLAEEILNAIVDVLKQQSPTIDFDSLINAAILVGRVEGKRQDLDEMLINFKHALPYSVQQQLKN